MSKRKQGPPQKRANRYPANRTPQSKALPDAQLIAAVVLLLLCIGYAIWAAGAGWSNTLNDHHSFRQTQTAITTYYLKDKPFKLAYETPVLGKPWAIPMEFPIYQWIVARLSSFGHWPLDQTGRAVSLGFFLLMLEPVYFLLGAFRVRPEHRLLMLSVVLASPFYLFWSRTFLIESCALFFCFAYLACIHLWQEKKSIILLIIAVLFGTGAALSKVTTWLPFLLAAFLLVIRDWLHWPLANPPLPQWVRKATVLSCVCGLPFLMALWWVHYSDALKAVHPLDFINTAANSRAWNFGTLDQKFSLDIWLQILARAYTLFGHPWPAWGILFTSGFAVAATRRRWKEALLCTAFFLLSPAIFTNLHLIHDYYMNANGVFLLLTTGFGIVALLETAALQSLGWVLIGLTLVSECFGHLDLYRPLQQMPNSEVLELAQFVKKNVTDDGIFIGLGFDWSPLVPYYSERRALLIPDWKTLTPDQVRRALENLKGCNVEALLVMEPHRYPLDLLREQIHDAGLAPKEIRVQGLPQR